MIGTRVTAIQQKLRKISCYVAVYNHDQFTQEGVNELKLNVRSLLVEIRGETQAINQEMKDWHA